MNFNLDRRYIGNGYYYVTEVEAKNLCKESDPNHTMTRLPKNGRERRVIVNDEKCWLCQTIVSGHTVWSIRLCS